MVVLKAFLGINLSRPNQLFFHTVNQDMENLNNTLHHSLVRCLKVYKALSEGDTAKTMAGTVYQKPTNIILPEYNSPLPFIYKPMKFLTFTRFQIKSTPKYTPPKYKPNQICHTNNVSPGLILKAIY